MSDKLGQELNLAISLVGLEFVFLTLMMNIPREDVLFNQTISFYLPFYYAVSLPKFIQSCIITSSSVMIMSIIFYLSLYNIRNDPYGVKKSKLHKAARCILYIGSYYWMLLFISVLIIYNIKYHTIIENYDISGIYLLLVIFGSPIIQYILFDTLLPEVYNIEIFQKTKLRINFKIIIYLGHLIFWGIMWSDIIKYIMPSFLNFTPFHIQFSSTLILIIVLSIIALSNQRVKIYEQRYVI